MFHSSIRWVLSLNWLSQKWGQVQINGPISHHSIGFVTYQINASPVLEYVYSWDEVLARICKKTREMNIGVYFGAMRITILKSRHSFPFHSVRNR